MLYHKAKKECNDGPCFYASVYNSSKVCLSTSMCTVYVYRKTHEYNRHTRVCVLQVYTRIHDGNTRTRKCVLNIYTNTCESNTHTGI